MSTLIEVWKKLISVFMPDFEGFKTSVEEITITGGELEVEPEDGTESL